MLDIVSLVKQIADNLTPFLPALISKAGTEGAGALAKGLGEEAASEIKSVWKHLLSKSSDPSKVEDAAVAAVANPSDDDAAAALRFQIRNVLGGDISEAEHLLNKLRSANNRMQIQMKSGTGSQLAMTGHASIGGNVDMSTRVGLTAKELDDREESKKLGDILSLFDRLALKAPIPEETISEMTKSIREIRLSMQLQGASTIKDTTAKLILSQIQEELANIEQMNALLLRNNSSESTNTAFQMVPFLWIHSRADMSEVERLISAGGNHKLRSQLNEIENWLYHLTKWFNDDVYLAFKKAENQAASERQEYREIETHNRAVGKMTISRVLGTDLFTAYLFGAIDQLRLRIQAKVEFLLGRLSSE